MDQPPAIPVFAAEGALPVDGAALAVTLIFAALAGRLFPFWQHHGEIFRRRHAGLDHRYHGALAVARLRLHRHQLAAQSALAAASRDVLGDDLDHAAFLCLTAT